MHDSTKLLYMPEICPTSLPCGHGYENDDTMPPSHVHRIGAGRGSCFVVFLCCFVVLVLMFVLLLFSAVLLLRVVCLSGLQLFM